MAAALAATMIGILLCWTAIAEEVGVAPPAGPPNAQATSPATEPSPGNPISRWFNESMANITTGLKAAQKAVVDVTGQARDAAVDAATAVARLPSTGVVSGRERCSTAPNGAPDCRSAIEALCRSKGFATGHSLDTDTQKYCPPQALAAGQLPKITECVYVTRAICQ